MKKDIKKIFIIVFLVFIFTIKSSYAKPPASIPHRLEGVNRIDSKTETENCTFISMQSSTLRIRINTGGAEKSGYLWKISDSEGAPLYCLDPDRHSTKCLYNRSRRINPNTEDYYYRAYQYYLDNMRYQPALLYTQTAFWYFWQTSGERSADGLEESLYTAMLSKLCYDNESQIAQLLDSDEFTCARFMNGNSIEGHPYSTRNGKLICADTSPAGTCRNYKRKSTDAQCAEWKNTDIDTYNSNCIVKFEDYLNLYKFNRINTLSSLGIDASQVEAQTRTDAHNVAQRIFGYRLYDGSLYLWEPDNDRCQRFIGLQGCTTDATEPKCETDLATLLEKYPVDNRTRMNITYYNKLKVVLRNEKTYEKITDPDFIRNPYCDPVVESPSCLKDLMKLLEYQEKGPQEEYDKLFLQMLIDYPSEFNGNSKDPDCKTESIPPRCDGEYEDNGCDFVHTEKTLYMNDSTDKSCWVEKQIAYTTNDEIVSSVFENVSPYCTVTCRELFQVDFPSGKDNIKAGEEFFWGFGEPSEAYFGNVNASKTCFTSYPNYTQFQADWSANEQEIKRAYARYMAQKNYNSQSNTDVKVDNNHCCISGYSAATSSGRSYSPQSATRCIQDALWCTCYNGSNETTILGKDWDIYCPDGYSFYQVSETSGTPEQCTGGWGKTYKLDSKTYTFEGITESSSSRTSSCVSESSIPSASDLYDYNEETKRYNTLNYFIDSRSTLKTNIEKCQSNIYINSSSIYHNITELKLTYTDPASGVDRNIEGATLINKNNWSDFNNEGSVLDRTSEITLNCTEIPGFEGGPTCGTNVQKYIEYYWNFTGLWRYYYNTEIFTWKFLLENGHAVNIQKYDESYKSFQSADGTVGFIASFKLITGFYEFAKVDVTNFGSDGHFNALFEDNNDGDNVYEYTCPFMVINEIYGSECRYECDYNTRTCSFTADSPAYCKSEVKGLDVVYRIIELTSAEESAAGNINTVFPGIVGTGRKLGTNWSNFYKDNRTKYNNITTYNNIYDGGPIYTIDLTPALIQEIRADNATYRNHKDGETNKPMDPYTSMKYTNGSKKYLCSDDTPKDQTCASEWLSNLSQRGLLTGEYGEIKDTKARLEAIRKAKDSTEASGTKNVTVVGGA